MTHCPPYTPPSSATHSRRFHNRPRRKVLPQRVGAELFAHVHLRLRLVRAVRLELDHIESQMIECGAHRVELVLRLDDQFVVVMKMGPLLLLFGERPVVPLAAPFLSRSADPAVKNLPARKLH